MLVVLVADLGEVLGRAAVALHVLAAGVAAHLRSGRRGREAPQLDHLAELLAHGRAPVGELHPEAALLHLLEADRHHAVGDLTGDELAGEEQRARTRRAVVVHVDDRDAAHADLVERLLTAGGVAVAIGGDGLLDLVIPDAGIVECLVPASLAMSGLVPVPAPRLLELRHAHTDDENLASHGRQVRAANLREHFWANHCPWRSRSDQNTSSGTKTSPYCCSNTVRER